MNQYPRSELARGQESGLEGPGARHRLPARSPDERPYGVPYQGRPDYEPRYYHRSAVDRFTNWVDRLVNGVLGSSYQPHNGFPTKFQARLVSSLDGAYFQAEIDVFWPRSKPSPQETASAEMLIREVIQEVVRQYSVLHVGEAATAVNLALQALPKDAPRAICHLTSEPEGMRFSKQHENLARDVTRKRASRQAELEEMAFFAHNVLPYPNLVRVWWLQNDPNRIKDLVDNATMFEEAASLFAAAPGSAAEDPIPGLLRGFLSGLGPEHRDLLLKQMKEIFLGYERQDLADLVDPLLEPAPMSEPPGPNVQPRPDAGSTPDGSGAG